MRESYGDWLVLELTLRVSGLVCLVVVGVDLVIVVVYFWEFLFQ